MEEKKFVKDNKQEDTEGEFKVGEVPTQTERVIVTPEKNVLRLDEAIALLLNKASIIEKAVVG